jgi:hypothetical protein
MADDDTITNTIGALNVQYNPFKGKDSGLRSTRFLAILSANGMRDALKTPPAGATITDNMKKPNAQVRTTC